MVTLTPQQQVALTKLQQFSQDPQGRAFVLRGYAGTGKTTLLGRYAQWLREQSLEPELLATTGRAAKVLAAKTDLPTRTIHTCVYQFNEMSDATDAGEQLTLQFGVRTPPEDADNQVYIVDEASMIANTATTGGQVAKFGSGHLLLDFLAFTESRKVVFVGDPCQLPPVSADTFSPALSPRYLRDQYKVAVQYAELSDIVRQAAESEILEFATRFRRDILHQHYVKWPKMAVPSGRQVHLLANEQVMVKQYLRHLRAKDYQNAIMVTNANGHCRRLNHKLRMQLMGNKNLTAGELLMVVQNSYTVPLTNGDQVMVKEVKPAGRRAGFGFLEVTLGDVDGKNTYQTLLIRDLLYNDNPGLTPEESRRLLIDFDRRMKNNGLSRKSEVYQKLMRKDPYLNALRAKFGYVITCHKAQGSEWPQVYLNIQKSVFVQPRNALYRWFYTALTRASEHLYLNDNFWIQGFAQRQPAVAKRQFIRNQQKKKR